MSITREHFVFPSLFDFTYWFNSIISQLNFFPYKILFPLAKNYANNFLQYLFCRKTGFGRFLF